MDEGTAAVQRYHDLLQEAQTVRKTLPAVEILGMASNGFVLAEEELVDVIERLGKRRSDIDELLSVAKSVKELTRKVVRLSERLMTEVQERSDA